MALRQNVLPRKKYIPFVVRRAQMHDQLPYEEIFMFYSLTVDPGFPLDRPSSASW